MRKLLLLALLAIAGFAQAGELKPYAGSPLPDFTLTDLQGQKHTLRSYHGKVVMLNFWATYCGPCIKEMPSMQRLNEKLADKPFTIIAVNMAEEKSDVEAFFAKYKIKVTFPILLDPEGEAVEKWMISAVPTTFIIDKEGKIRYAMFGGLEWDSDEVVKTLNGLMK